ncbi:hypothetical protein Tco_0442826 [Tanacetum coccineum]
MASTFIPSQFDTINELAKDNLITGLPKFKYSKDHLFPSCEQGKSKKSPHKPKPVPNFKDRLHLLHMDLCVPMRVESINGKRVYNHQTKKIMETMNVTFDELSAMAFEQHSGQPSDATRTAPAAPATQNLQTPNTSTTIDVNELQQQQHVQQQGNQSQLQSEALADNVHKAMFDENMFINPYAPPSTSSAESSSQYVDPSNMYTFYQPYQYEYQWIKDHPLEQVIGEPSRPVLTRNQLRTDA